MADKMFYSLDEAATRLGKSEAEVRDLASRGQLQEFRDRDRLMFKKEQVDLLAGGGDEGDVIPLAESGELEPLSLASSGTGISLDSPKEATGISIFEADATDEADANAVTRITASPGAGMVDPGDARSASGSGGLLDLTREADDTSLGAGLLEDVYGSETVANATAQETAIGGGGMGDGALFETPGAAEAADTGAPVGVYAMPEAYDGLWSGITGGLAFGVIISALVASFVLITGFTSTAGGGLMSAFASQFWILVGICAGAVVIGGVVGMVLGKRS